MKWGKSKEGWLGVVLTAVLCLGFLYWWFRPEPRVWEQENAGQLVERAMKEPRPDSQVERQVIDFDLMEVAICQGRSGMLDEAVATVKHIANPAIKMRAVRQLAQTYLNSDPQDFGEVIGLADLIDDPVRSAAVRTEVLGQLAVLGFADAAIPEARTARQKAVLARQMAGTDDKSQAKARDLIAEAEKELPSLPPAEAVAIREDIARARINLSPVDGPEAAITAIQAVPPDRQPLLWKDLSDWCVGQILDLRTLMPNIADPDLRRRLEIESLLFSVKPWPAAEIIAKYQAEVDAAAAPEAKVAALISLSEARRNGGEPDNTAATAAANQTLQNAHTVASGIGDAAARCRSLLELTKKFSLALLFDDAKASLEEATKAARAVQPLGARVPLLIAAAEEHLLQASAPQANALITEAADEASATAPDAAALQALAVAVIRRGDWPRGLALADRIPDDAARLSALEAAAESAAEESLSMDPADPPPRGEPVDDIRREAAGDQARAARLVEQQPKGYARARAWLAMAKGQIAPPSSLSDYMAAGSQPVDAPDADTAPSHVTPPASTGDTTIEKP